MDNHQIRFSKLDDDLDMLQKFFREIKIQFIETNNRIQETIEKNSGKIAELKKAGEEAGERVWEMPLWDEYFEQLKSDVADMRNIGGRGGGMITAGMFLSKFVGDYPWVHLDIASTDWSSVIAPNQIGWIVTLRYATMTNYFGPRCLHM